MRKKSLLVCLLSGMMLLSGACAGGDGSGGSPPQDEYPKNVDTVKEYSLKDGVIDVDMAAYMRKHEILNQRPVEARDAAILGNGAMGVSAYQEEDSFVFHLGRGDIFGKVEGSGAPEEVETLPAMGQLRLRSETKFYQTATGFEQRLSLYDGILSTRYATGITRAESELFVYAAEEGADVLAMKYSDRTPGEEVRSLEFSIWENRHPQFSYEESTGILYVTETYPSRAGGNGYTLGLYLPGVETACRTDEEARTAALDFAPARTTDCVFYAASAVGYEAQDRVRKELLAAAEKGYDALRAEHVAWWHDFFADSFISLSEGGKQAAEADYIEGLWYFNLYLMASGARYEYPFKFNGGLWHVDKDYREWGSGYWNWNTRDLYWPLLTAGKRDLMRPYFSLYSGLLDRVAADTPGKFAADGPYATIPRDMGWDPFPAKGEITGVKFPETMDYDGVGLENQYVFLIVSTGADIAMLYRWYYEYTLDEDFLVKEAYPLMKGVADFIRSYAGEKEADGAYHFRPSNAREQWWNVSDASDAIAGSRALFGFLLSVRDKVGADERTVAAWQDFYNHLTDLPATDSRYLPAASYNPTDRKNADNPETEMVFPYGLSGIGAEDYEMALRTYLHRNSPLAYGWTPETIVSARLGLGEETFANLLAGTERFQVFANGLTHYQGISYAAWDRMFYMEFNGILATTVNEMLLQSYDGVIRVFPAVPRGEVFQETKFTLHAAGGFRVTSELLRGSVKYVAVTSGLGGTCRIANPFGNGVRVTTASGIPVAVTGEDGIVQFDTVEGEVYLLTAANADLSGYRRVQMTGTSPTQPRKLGAVSYGKRR